MQPVVSPRVGVVIPCFRVRDHILGVLEKIDSWVERIYVVDDCCPEGTGDCVAEQCRDPRVRVLRSPKNLGVGGATRIGYAHALKDDMDIVVKLDGDGQMSEASIESLVKPIVLGLADYAKGNRFYDLDFLRPMPWIRIVGNSGLSLITKISSGYWSVMDPTNGFTAIHGRVLASLNFEELESRYFFESDLLYRLYLIRAVVWDVPMYAVYGDEKSNLAVARAIPEFALKHLLRCLRRIFYCYFLRDFQAGSVLLLSGLSLVAFGFGFGGYHWYLGHQAHALTPLGTIMVAALPFLIGLQMLLSFLSCDMSNVPVRPIHPYLVAKALEETSGDGTPP